ncbi:MAG: hypothetical protein ACJ8HU_11380 [Chthoniobacterales bacterium]
MRFEWLFLRWLAIIVVVVLGARYAWTHRETGRNAQYQKVLLLQNSSSFGLPLAGVVVDPERKEIYGLLGRSGKDVPADFFILWKGKNGESYGATFAGDSREMTGLCKILPHGETRTLNDFRTAKLEGKSRDVEREPSDSLRQIVNALPSDPSLPGKD